MMESESPFSIIERAGNARRNGVACTVSMMAIRIHVLTVDS